MTFCVSVRLVLTSWSFSFLNTRRDVRVKGFDSFSNKPASEKRSRSGHLGIYNTLKLFSLLKRFDSYVFSPERLKNKGGGTTLKKL